MSLVAQSPSPFQILLSIMLRVDEDDILPSNSSLRPARPDPIPTEMTRRVISNLASAKDVASAPFIRLSFDFPDTPYYPGYTMARTEPASPGLTSHLPSPPNPLPLKSVFRNDHALETVLHQVIGGGSFGSTYLGNIGQDIQIVAKFAHEDTKTDVLREGWFYQYPLNSLCGTVLPSYFGVFQGEGRTALLVAYAGTPIKSFDSLGESARQDILNHIASLHRLGVSHNDLAPRNILAGPDGRYTIIDLGVAALHTCSDGCYEMTEMRKLLGVRH
ncbi:hypothetical protein BOTBODRAFT_301466 [Botryobasidium botryosum FD-172 SS1]|uniref:Protein kinase domain-containing protein n=1 Tax=Botryobasidium botryosum (strain FD-172 SS1) TaxID=930990 RepID=A0A067MH07_BOTB1|nr:hypothetical protein BOTBODRAFT_301466 [Botryobasidium botryosum FD-172 SS1]